MTPISQTLQKTISRKCLSFLALFIFFFFNNYFAFSQQNKIETGNFFVSNYSRSFLNSISGNWSILQDPDGVIYIGNTYDGILIYDGQKIRRVNDGHGSPKLGLTRSLLIDSKNTIYTIIGNEFGYIEKNSFGESDFVSLSKLLPSKDQVNSTL